jgi:hypothetical protein
MDDHVAGCFDDKSRLSGLMSGSKRDDDFDAVCSRQTKSFAVTAGDYEGHV